MLAREAPIAWLVVPLEPAQLSVSPIALETEAARAIDPDCGQSNWNVARTDGKERGKDEMTSTGERSR